VPAAALVDPGLARSRRQRAQVVGGNRAMPCIQCRCLFVWIEGKELTEESGMEVETREHAIIDLALAIVRHQASMRISDPDS
jgi:hypothetical protein